MVNSVYSNRYFSQLANTTAPTNPNEVKQLLKYVNNQALKEVPDSFVSTTKGAVKMGAAFNVLPALSFAKNTKKLTGHFLNAEAKTLSQINKAALKNIFKGTEGNILTRTKDYLATVTKNSKKYEALRESVSQQVANMKNGAAEAAATVAEPGKLSKLFGAVTKPFKALKSVGSKALSKITGPISRGLNKITFGASGKIGKLIKSSGAGFMLAFSGIMECLTEVIPTFKQLGAKKGMKQIGKSAVKVVGDTAGYIAGAKVGLAIGSAICPGIGSVIGFVGGILGSFVAGKITKAIIGPSEREIAQKEQENQIAKEIANDSTSVNELKSLAQNKMQEEVQYNGGLSEDGATVNNILNKMNEEQQTARTATVTQRKQPSMFNQARFYV